MWRKVELWAHNCSCLCSSIPTHIRCRSSSLNSRCCWHHSWACTCLRRTPSSLSSRRKSRSLNIMSRTGLCCNRKYDSSRIHRWYHSRRRRNPTGRAAASPPPHQRGPPRRPWRRRALLVALWRSAATWRERPIPPNTGRSPALGRPAWSKLEAASWGWCSSG